MDNKILKTKLVEWKKLKLFQPEDLKKMSANQLNKIKTSFRKNGFKSPFFVWEDKNSIWCLDGNTRIPILKLLESEGEAVPEKLPANFIDCKNKAEAKKAILIYNSHYADINQDIFNNWISDLNIDDLLQEIDIKGIDIDLEIIDNENYNIPDNVKKITNNDDLWQLGAHKLLCANSLVKDNYQKVILNDKINMVFTDPPYNLKQIVFMDYLLNVCDNNIFLMHSDKMQVNIAYQYIDYFKKFFILPFKTNILLNNNSPMSGHILIAHYCKDKQNFKNNKDNFSTVLKVYDKNKQLKDLEHRHKKDTGFIEEIIIHFSKKNNIILDIFAGAGSTLMACMKHNRISYNIEKNPNNCDIIINRYNDWCIDNNIIPNIKLNGKKKIIK